jgi:adenine-specific DNA-methyltransferase
VTMAKVEKLEIQRQALQEQLNGAKTQVARNKLGQFATPQVLAAEIVDCAMELLPKSSPIRFLEPGFGLGPFYSALLSSVPQKRIAVAAGYELDQHYAEPARQLWQGTGLQLVNADFIKAEPPEPEAEKYNLVVCNPPYVRHHHLSQTQKQELQAAMARHLNFEMNGLSGLYTYFLVLSKAWMAKEGIGVWLIPSEFMDVNYGRKVKEFLTSQVTLLRIHRFDPDDAQFEDALVSSAVVFFKNVEPPAGHKVEFTYGGTLRKPNISGKIGLNELREIPKWTGLSQDVARFNEKNTGSIFADLFTIKRGLATGCNSFFIMSPEQATQRNLPKEFLLPILPSPRGVKNSEIVANGNGEPALPNKLYLISCSLPETDIKKKHPSLWKYYQQGLDEKVNEGYLCASRKPWYSQEIRPAAPFLCTYMGRTSKDGKSPFRFILNLSNATAANVYQMLYPKPVLAAWLGKDTERHRAVLKALSAITPELLIGEGRVYGGGLHKLEPKELANVPADVILKTLRMDDV